MVSMFAVVFPFPLIYCSFFRSSTIINFMFSFTISNHLFLIFLFYVYHPLLPPPINTYLYVVTSYKRASVIFCLDFFVIVGWLYTKDSSPLYLLFFSIYSPCLLFPSRIFFPTVLVSPHSPDSIPTLVYSRVKYLVF